jgi:hypothetical protein
MRKETLKRAAFYARDAAYAASLAIYPCIDGGFEVPIETAIAAASNAASAARDCASAAVEALAEYASSAPEADADSDETLDVVEAVAAAVSAASTAEETLEAFARNQRADDEGRARRAGALRAHDMVAEAVFLADRAAKIVALSSVE